MLSGAHEVGKVESELKQNSVARLGHLYLGYFLLLGGGCGKLELLELAEHIHVALELKFRSFDEYCNVLSDFLIFQLKARLRIHLSDFLAFLLVGPVLLDAKLVVLIL